MLNSIKYISWKIPTIYYLFSKLVYRAEICTFQRYSVTSMSLVHKLFARIFSRRNNLWYILMIAFSSFSIKLCPRIYIYILPICLAYRTIGNLKCEFNVWFKVTCPAPTRSKCSEIGLQVITFLKVELNFGHLWETCTSIPLIIIYQYRIDVIQCSSRRTKWGICFLSDISKKEKFRSFLQLAFLTLRTTLWL